MASSSTPSSPLLYSCIAYRTTILTEHTTSAASQTSSLASIILPKIDHKTPQKLTYTHNQNFVHYIADAPSDYPSADPSAGGLTYLVVASSSFGRRIPFGYLVEIKKQFLDRYDPKETDFASLPPYGAAAFNSQLKNLMVSYGTTQAGKNDAIGNVQQEIEDVKGIMTQNIERVLERGERIDLLVDKTDRLGAGAHDFRVRSRGLRRRMWWKNIKLMVLLVVVVIFLLYIFIGFGCGLPGTFLFFVPVGSILALGLLLILRFAKRNHPSSHRGDEASNPLFPGLNFSIPSFPPEPQHWAILGASSSGKTTILEILRGQHLCFPPTARSFPYLSSDWTTAKDAHLRDPGRAIQYIGFSSKGGGLGEAGTRGAYLSARYESWKEKTDFSLLDYLKGNTSLYPLDNEKTQATGQADESAILEKVVKSLHLEELLSMPVVNLSNGQSRRARIAKALMDQPEALLLDEPFMGLDPPTLTTLSPLLYTLAQANTPRLILALRPQDPLPEWITHLVYLGPGLRVAFQGKKADVWKEIKEKLQPGAQLQFNFFSYLPLTSLFELGQTLTGTKIKRSEVYLTQAKRKSVREGLSYMDQKAPKIGEVLVEMEGVHVEYGEKAVLGAWMQDVGGQPKAGLWWTVKRGERWGIFGPNGSGKTTILSLICSEHPQAYSLPLKLFGRPRLPQPGQPGISIFDIQSRIGHSSPEIHAFFPRALTIRQTLENAWADTFLSKPVLTYERDSKVDACLRWFRAELNPSLDATTDHIDNFVLKGVQRRPDYPFNAPAMVRALISYDQIDNDWADEVRFRDVPFSSQKVALFLRAIIKNPDLVILDEAFSGMDSMMRDKCMIFLTWGEVKGGRVIKESNTFQRNVDETVLARKGRVVLGGLKDKQALICVSHVKEEVPGVVSQWMYLPVAETGTPARFGRLTGRLEAHNKSWNKIWKI